MIQLILVCLLFQWKVFAKHIEKYAAFYNTSNIIMTMGGDFTYTDADYWFQSTDKLIRYFVQHIFFAIHVIYKKKCPKNRNGYRGSFPTERTKNEFNS